MDIAHDEAVRAVVQRPAVYVHADASLRRVATTLTEESIGVVVVRNPNPSVAWSGVVSERDIVEAVAAAMDLDQTRAVDVMTSEIVFARPDEPLLVVARRMLDNEIRHLPIVEDDVVVGMVSARDALQVLAEEVGDAAMRDELTSRPSDGIGRLVSGAPVSVEEKVTLCVRSQRCSRQDAAAGSRRDLGLLCSQGDGSSIGKLARS